jgi:hypothetical protein
MDRSSRTTVVARLSFLSTRTSLSIGKIPRVKVERLTELSPDQLQKNIYSASWVKTFKDRNDILKLRTDDRGQGIIVE